MQSRTAVERHVNDWGKIKNIIRDSLSDFLWKRDETESDDPSNYYGSINTTGQKGGMTEDEPDDQRDQPGYRDSDQAFP